MKKVSIAVAALLLSISVSYANNYKEEKVPFDVNFSKLSEYLQLNSHQSEEVQNINEYFIEMQNKSLRTKSDRKDAAMHQAVYGNLKLMKQTLSPEQYRKYVILLNVTNNNNHILKGYSLVNSTLVDLGK